MKKNNTCNTCKHWKNQQSELDYSEYSGICTCFKWKFGIANEESVKLLDRQNKSDKFMGVHRFENQNKDVPVGAPERSRYCLVTDDKFGCIHHINK